MSLYTVGECGHSIIIGQPCRECIAIRRQEEVDALRARIQEFERSAAGLQHELEAERERGDVCASTAQKHVDALRKVEDNARNECVQLVMDLYFALRELKQSPTLRDLVKLAKRMKE